MDTFARIALHEMSHMSSVGPPITKDPEDEDDDGLIKYVQMADGDTPWDRRMPTRSSTRTKTSFGTLL